MVLLSICFFCGCATESPTNWNRITYPDRKARSGTPVRINRLALSGSKLFKDYDAAFIDKIQQTWSDLLEAKTNSRMKGVVVLQFALSSEGKISDLMVIQNTANDEEMLICRKAILDSAPFPAWSEEMRRDLKTNSRPIKFTFNYY